MATSPDTITGTITLTSGSVNFTTSGVNMLTRGHLPGDEIYSPATGAWLIIETITGENAGTLRYACPAACAVVGGPVTIRFQPDGSRVKAESRNLITLLGNGNLAAEAGLTGAADKISYYTGAATKALADFKAWARSLFGLTMAADKIPYGTGANTMALADFGAAARSLLAVTAAANKLPYFTGAGAAAVTDFFAWARSMLGLTMAADQVPYGTGANTMDLMTVTAAARTLLDDADVAAMRATLLARNEAQAVVPLAGLANVDVTIPSWANTVELSFYNASPSALATMSLWLTDAGGVEITGYNGVVTQDGVNTALSAAFTIAASVPAASAVYGNLILKRTNANVWVATSNIAVVGTPSKVFLAGGKGTSEATTSLRIAVNTGTFDAGSVRAFFEE